MARPFIATVLAGSVSTAVVGAVLFVAAGRTDLPFFWAYLGLWIAATVASGLVIDPTLVRERILPGAGARDVPFTGAFVLLALGQLAVAGLDVGRFHWSDTVPAAAQAAGLLAVIAALAVASWALAVNPFFSSVIRIQTDRGHRLITAGPYRWVRHPAYAAGPFLMIGTGVALGSWAGALVGLLLVAMVVRRTAEEDRVLRAELAGYEAYAGWVRYRLIPGVW
jgi:protein-S-isoprenylcysteine O-methyltransferase Ste14